MNLQHKSCTYNLNLPLKANVQYVFCKKHHLLINKKGIKKIFSTNVC